MNLKKTIESLIKQGMTQQEIARKCGCGQATISEIVTGRIQAPRFHVGQALIKLHDKTKTKRSKA